MQEVWLRSDTEFPYRPTVAVILNIFAFDFYATGFFHYRGVRPDDLRRRSVDDWLASVESSEDECSRLSPQASGWECREVIDSLCAILAEAGQAWASESPLEPPCELVVKQMIHTLASAGLVRIHWD